MTDGFSTPDEPNGRMPSNGVSGPRWRRWCLFVGLALLALYVTGFFLTGDRVPAGTTVAGVDIGGLRADTAREKLNSELADVAAAPVTFVYDGKPYVLKPEASGLHIDVEQTLRDADAYRSWYPGRMVKSLLGSGGDVEPVIAIDRHELRSAVREISAQVESDPVEPSVFFNRQGIPTIMEPVVGIDVDERAAVRAAGKAYLGGLQPLGLPVDLVEPSVTQAALGEARGTLLKPAVSAPVMLKLPGRSFQVPVQTYAPALSFTAKDGELVASIDGDDLASRLATITGQLSVPPRDATVVLRDGSPEVIPDKPGSAIRPQRVADAILPVLTESGKARSAAVATTTTRADFTTADARALQIKKRVSNFVTYYPYAEYRNINQSRAAELINGTVLKPGETFSFNDTVGERTKDNGFVEGFIISDGVFAEELGGGVSQVVTTTYNAAFFAGLKDVEHTPHSFYIDRYPLGREATVAWPTVDLKFRNDTPYGVLIRAWVVPGNETRQGEMHVQMYSTKYWDITAGVSNRYNRTAPKTRYDPKNTCVANTGYGGFDVDVHRYFRKASSGQLVKKETDHVTYTPSDTVICSAPPE
ncbi:MAG: Vancomycin B-type resistance protein VanW [uncultured Chloroflexia bacterium]|uniref:Vancomycin B-type resistance protein VanW n=1 Tax=uncultured Chloroflexia bacterium TaxID=1672391 RepID=A0A6J4L1J2_9CHLR|nr:MAG: Vancomycin B-type resistance protein VanW [uncultured Chloroflexia bacterium]